MSLQLIGTNGFLREAENNQFCVVGRFIVITSNLKISRRATRSFFLIQPIMVLICDVVVRIHTVNHPFFFFFCRGNAK